MLLSVLFGMQHPSVTSAIRWGASGSSALRKCSDFIPMSSNKIQNIEEDIHHYELWFNKQFQPTTTKTKPKTPNLPFLTTVVVPCVCIFSNLKPKKHPPKRRSFVNLQLLSRPPSANGETLHLIRNAPFGAHLAWIDHMGTKWRSKKTGSITSIYIYTVIIYDIQYIDMHFHVWFNFVCMSV